MGGKNMTELENVLLHFSTRKLDKILDVELTPDEVDTLVDEWKHLNEKGLSLQNKCAKYEEKDFIWKERDKALNAKTVKEVFTIGTCYAAFFAGVTGLSFGMTGDLSIVDFAKIFSGVFMGIEVPTVLASSALSLKGKVLNTKIDLTATKNEKNNKKKEQIATILGKYDVKVGQDAKQGAKNINL